MSESAASVDSRFTLPFRVSSATGLAAGAILLLALVLRILGAQGELWLDELWSLRLIDEVRARHDFLWGLAIDNNHYLNTLWLWIVGADAPVLLQRAFAIALGVVTVLVAGVAMRRSGTAGVLCAMAIFAVSYAMVNYGSEARGYAGLILAILIAILLTERVATPAATEPSRKMLVWLGVICTAGVLFQPIMLSTILGLMAWTAWINRPMRAITFGSLLATVRLTARRFTWAARILIPFAAVIAYAVLHSEGYRIGGSVPFTAEGFVRGYGGLIHILLGLPEAVPDWVGLVLVVVATGLVFILTRNRDDHRLSLYFIFLLAIPAAMFVARLPNIYFPRYYLASGTVFLLLLVDLFGWAWNRGSAHRLLALVAVAAIAVGNGFGVAWLMQHGRDETAAVMRLIGEAGPVMVTSDQDARNSAIVEFMAHHLDLPITYVPNDEICAKQPEWLISSSSKPDMPAAVDTSVKGCMRIYERQATFPQWGLSGLPWTVYRVRP